MPAPTWLIGTAPDCDVRIGDPTVSGRHCRLTRQRDGFLLEDLRSKNGTFIAGEAITAPQVVQRGDVVLLGTRTALPWAEIPEVVTIGRADDNDVVIPLDAVSARHARLERRGTHVSIVDLGSTNGTAVNDLLRKQRQAAVHPGDFVFLGTHRIAADELLAVLPGERESPQTIVGSPPREEPVESPDAQPRDDWFASFRSARSWAIGIVASVLVAVMLVVANRWLQTDAPDHAVPSESVSGASAATTAAD